MESTPRLSRQQKKTLKREKLRLKWEDQKKQKKTKVSTTEQPLIDPVKTAERRERRRVAAVERALKELENPEILIDCDFHDIMSTSEQASIAVQVAHSYSVVKRMQKRPVRLALCGAHEELLKKLKKNSGFHQWKLQIYENKIEQDPRPIENLIYLTPDAEQELDLDQLNKDHVLVVGGFVDRNRHKGLTFKKARELGIKTAKLPLENFVHLIASQVLAVNHVVDILATAFDTSCWETAVKKVIPERKVLVQ